MKNGTTKSKLLENYDITTICQETVRERIINLGFKYNYVVNNSHTQWWLQRCCWFGIVSFQHATTVLRYCRKIGEKGNFGVWLSFSMKLVERPVICLVQDEAILKKYIFAKKMCTHKGICRRVPKYKGYGIMISNFQSW